jgi:hypothetical protein
MHEIPLRAFSYKVHTDIYITSVVFTLAEHPLFNRQKPSWTWNSIVGKFLFQTGIKSFIEDVRSNRFPEFGSIFFFIYGGLYYCCQGQISFKFGVG